MEMIKSLVFNIDLLSWHSH